ncbi:preprotein translocase subunit SecG [Novosphingobium aerophilum]|uniref:preprotein translocase subunit SecG n=1 Tax=Novosphingobium TaxID=165696 RepID=UPI0012C885EF|nr:MULTISPECIES: preprotein translocase subunit SecG [unclassified Novosphingobium]MPS69400.1 preprotein translocase subunit SecG [Novosphingobium sp.]WRT91850.1 preprotein translocase subunit SecG [Novosphingobium sp. RL4]
MFLFLTVVQAIVALLLVGVILMQKSEGGGLGVGGSPSGIMSARGAANFLTRATGILAAVFVILSIVLAALAVNETTGRDIDTSLQRETAPAAPAQPADPLAGPAAPAAAPADGASPAPAGAAPAGTTPANDPLSGAAGR